MYKDETEQVQFVQAINDLTAEGGGDCPEYTFTGILRAIYEAPRWGSPMYVFTDAYPKDATDSNVDEVEALAADYGLTINFFTTGGLTLSLPRVINIKFPLQPHQKYYMTQYEELGFS